MIIKVTRLRLESRRFKQGSKSFREYKSPKTQIYAHFLDPKSNSITLGIVWVHHLKQASSLTGCKGSGNKLMSPCAIVGFARGVVGRSSRRVADLPRAMYGKHSNVGSIFLITILLIL